MCLLPACSCVGVVVVVQGFRQEVVDRSMPELWYASVQWVHYLAFALLLRLAATAPGRAMGSGVRRGLAWLWGNGQGLAAHVVVLAALSLMGRWLALGPLVSSKGHPLLYLPYLAMGLASAATLTALTAHQQQQQLEGGGSAAGVEQQQQEGGRLLRWLGGQRHGVDGLVAALALLVVLPLGRFEGDPVDSLDVSLGWCLLPLLANAALLLLLLAGGSQQQASSGGVMGRVVRHPWAQSLGRLTFPLYLLHQVIRTHSP